ncbi:hypothetical protein COOONC_26672 [Cooperia oncophora]
MVNVRTTFLEIEKRDSDAARFFEHLWRTAGRVRHNEVSQPLETKTVVENFNALSENTREYLITKLRPLKILATFSKQNPPFGVETSTWSTAPTARTTSASAITGSLEKAIGFLQTADTLLTFAPVNDFSAILIELLRILNRPSLRWMDFTSIFESFGNGAKRLDPWCDSNLQKCKKTAQLLAKALESLIQAATETFPKNLSLKSLKENYSHQLSSSQAPGRVLLSTIAKFSETASILLNL